MRLRQTAAAALLAVVVPLSVLAQDASQSRSSGQEAADTNPLGMAMTRQHAETFEPGAPLQVAVTISAVTAGQITAMGLRETLPPGWKLEAVAGASGAPPDVSPAPGTAGLLEFAWITMPQFPYTFTYAATPPEGDGGTKVIHGALEYREMGGAHYAAPVITEVRGPDPKAPTITLKGDNPVTLNVGDAWQEPGYTALDGKNQDVTGKVVVNGTVDTSHAGEFGLTYTISADDGQHTAVSRRVVVKEGSAPETATPAGGIGGGAVPLREPGPAGREKSNPIAASVDKNPEKQAQGTAPAAATTEGEAGAAIKKPDLPDLSAFRPPAAAEGEDKPASRTDATGSSAAGHEAPTVTIAPVPHRAPVPKEMLHAAGLKEKGPSGAADAPSPAPVPKPPVSEESTGVVAGVVAGAGALLVVLGVLGWRLVYNRPIRRRRPPNRPSQ